MIFFVPKIQPGSSRTYIYFKHLKKKCHCLQSQVKDSLISDAQAWITTTVTTLMEIIKFYLEQWHFGFCFLSSVSNLWIWQKKLHIAWQLNIFWKIAHSWKKCQMTSNKPWIRKIKQIYTTISFTLTDIIHVKPMQYCWHLSKNINNTALENVDVTTYILHPFAMPQLSRHWVGRCHVLLEYLNGIQGKNSVA